MRPRGTAGGEAGSEGPWGDIPALESWDWGNGRVEMDGRGEGGRGGEDEGELGLMAPRPGEVVCSFHCRLEQ